MRKAEMERGFGKVTDKWVQAHSQLVLLERWMWKLVWLVNGFEQWLRTRSRRLFEPLHRSKPIKMTP